MREGEPYIVIERQRDGGFGSFILGALVGAGLALLLAPQSGEETQEEIKKQARRFRARAEERVRAAQEELESRLDEARAGVQSRVEGVRGAVESGRQAAREARSDLEHRLEQSKAAYRAGVDAARAAPSASGNDVGSPGAQESGTDGA
jgi:gas vesicle protein